MARLLLILALQLPMAMSAAFHVALRPLPALPTARTPPSVVMCDADPAPAVDKQMSSDTLITFAGLNDEWQPLVSAALIRLDRNRVLQGKPKYESIDGMTDAYVEEAASAGLGWTRADAESEVVRYLMRQALADEGGIGGDGGDGQDKAAFALLGLLLGLGAYSGFDNIGVFDAFKW